MAYAKEATTGRTILGPDLAGRLATRITADHPGFDLPFAERIVDQTGAFLAACAGNEDAPLSPSGTVDIGWHTFILHTREYAEWCDRVAGRFLHHVPDLPEDGEQGKAAAERQRTLDAITAAGYRVDAELWPETANCNQCHAGCHDSPTK
ncbi:hypothetical protein AB0939_22490 [Streptomyces sp. NPDC006990]|uniref:glycine-rich domain-containing protein n=1 Tax=unclassified Streptomyces TaxID=2593676 RepID=UPI003452466E